MRRARRPPKEPTERWPRTDVAVRRSRTQACPPTRDADPELYSVFEFLTALPHFDDRMSLAIRETYDQLYDGQRTGRWDYRQLRKTEKTHMGTLLEINLQREFEFTDGDRLDYRIGGIEVDCKFSRVLYQWEIPREMYTKGPQIALLVWAADHESRWLAGLLRTDPKLLKTRGNQDRKRKLNEEGVDSILWLQTAGVVPGNTLLQRTPEVRTAVLAPRSGQKRVNELFRLVQNELIDRETVVRVALQDDPMKRVREARKQLRHDGIVIFGPYQSHGDAADALDVKRPRLGQFVSARLAEWKPGDSGHHVSIEGKEWRRASEDDPCAPAPTPKAQGQRL